MPIPSVAIAIYRSVLTFLVLFLMARLMGKKQISQMTFFDYVVGITIGSIAASVSVELHETLVGLTSMVVWSLLAVFTGWLALKSPPFERLAKGVPVAAIQDGRILEKNLSNELVTIQDLLMKLRQQQVFSLDDVAEAFLERDGQLSVLLKGDRQPLTGKSTGIRVPPSGMPSLVILNGQIQHDALQKWGYGPAWLEKELEKQGVSDPKEVIAGQLDANGKLWLDLRDDQKNLHQPQAQKSLLANLLQSQTQLEMMAQDAGDTQARQLYRKLAQEVRKVMEDLEPLQR